MVFPTIEFAVFFGVVLPVSWLLMDRQSLWKPFALAASYFFYAAADWRFAFLLAGVTAINQIGAIAIAGAPTERRKTWILRAVLAADLGILGLFKYYGFFAQQISDTLDTVSLGMPLPLLTIALPIGISFYTFQAISYVVDVRRGEIGPASWIDSAVYLSFFPQIVAGPIVRAQEFMPQLEGPRNPNRVAVGAGLVLIAIGLVKKVAIADFLAREVVDPAFAVPAAYAGADLILAAYAYTAQIYCDFSGYTDMAIGIALLMGFSFPRNFASPYRATGFRDFWRRWHITLSRFLRDYLYVPLGGNRRGRLLTYRNLMITMLLGGLWHGAAWPFVLWGGFHGAGLVAERLVGGRFNFPVWLRWGVTFHLIVLGWILFRSPSFDGFTEYLSRLAEPGSVTLLSVPAALAITVVIGGQLLPERPLHRLQAWASGLPPAVAGAALGVLILFVAATVPSQGVPPFIYFQF